MELFDKIAKIGCCAIVLIIVGFYLGLLYDEHEHRLKSGNRHVEEFVLSDYDLRGWTTADVITVNTLKTAIYQELEVLEKQKGDLPFHNWEMYFASDKKNQRPAFIIVRHKELFWSPERLIYVLRLDDLDMEVREIQSEMKRVVAYEEILRQIAKKKIIPQIYTTLSSI